MQTSKAPVASRPLQCAISACPWLYGCAERTDPFVRKGRFGGLFMRASANGRPRTART